MGSVVSRLRSAVRDGRTSGEVAAGEHPAGVPPRAAVRDVYIVGTPFSGSTLLGNFLNGHSEVFHVGELSRLAGFDLGPPVDKVCQFCHMNEQACTTWDGALQERVVRAGPAHALETVRETVDYPVLIEGSKYPDWLRRVIDDGVALERTSMLLSVRSPFGFAASMFRHDDVHTTITAQYAAEAWRDTITAALELAATTPIPLLTVRYEALAASPELVGPAICGFLGIGYEPGMLEFWHKPSHALAGNGGAYVWYDETRGLENSVNEAAVDRVLAYGARRFGGWFDDSWMRELDASQVETIANVPAVREVAQSVGYRLDDMLGAYRAAASHR